MIGFKNFILERSCEYITIEQLKRVEKVLDKMFKKFEIDFDFTRHFADRMGDERNVPCISMEELGKVFTKIYRNRGTKIKSAKDFEAVIKDLSSDINMPVAVKYNPRSDDFRVALKTIMRKKDFRTPDKILRYK